MLVLDFFKPVDHRCRVFPLVEIGCSLDFVVDSIEDVFADFAYLYLVDLKPYVSLVVVPGFRKK